MEGGRGGDFSWKEDLNCPLDRYSAVNSSNTVAHCVWCWDIRRS
jgi:hypothetical protein